jgi:hypothetical protein
MPQFSVLWFGECSLLIPRIANFEHADFKAAQVPRALQHLPISFHWAATLYDTQVLSQFVACTWCQITRKRSRSNICDIWEQEIDAAETARAWYQGVFVNFAFHPVSFAQVHVHLVAGTQNTRDVIRMLQYENHMNEFRAVPTSALQNCARLAHELVVNPALYTNKFQAKFLANMVWISFVYLFLVLYFYCSYLFVLFFVLFLFIFCSVLCLFACLFVCSFVLYFWFLVFGCLVVCFVCLLFVSFLPLLHVFVCSLWFLAKY